MNQNRDADKLSVEVTGFVVGGWFMIKLGGVVVFVTEKNGGRRRNGGEWEDGRLSGHKLNITYGFIDEQI